MFTGRIANTGAVLLALALLAGCGKKEESKSAFGKSAPTPSATVPQAAPTAVPTSHATASAAAPAPAAILASADGEQPGMRAEVRSLKRDSGATVTLQFAVINDSDAEFSARTQLGATSHGDDDYQTVSGVHLVDPVNKKKYLVVRDAEKKCACSTGVYAVAAKSRSNLWAKFPAPANEVASLTVVIPRFMPMENVPIR